MEAPKGGLAASWGGSGVPGVGGRYCSGKKGEPKASGAERAGNIDHMYTSIIRKRDAQDRWWILDPL